MDLAPSIMDSRATAYDGVAITRPPGTQTDVAAQLGITSTLLLGIGTIGLAVAVHLLHNNYVERQAKRNALPCRLMKLYVILTSIPESTR